MNSMALARASDTFIWGQLGNWKYVGCRRWRMALEFNILEPLLCQAPSQERATLIVELGEAAYTVFREATHLAFAVPSTRNALWRPFFLFGFRNLLKSHLPREAPRALRSSLSHTSSLLKALLSNCLSACSSAFPGWLIFAFSLLMVCLPTKNISSTRAGAWCTIAAARPQPGRTHAVGAR